MSQAEKTDEYRYRLELLLKEAGFMFMAEPAPRKNYGHFTSKTGNDIQTAIYPESLFVWISARIECGIENLPIFESRLHECVLIARKSACGCIPGSSHDKLTLELGLPLFFQGMTYYALIDAVNHVDSAVLACTRILDPRHAQEARYGNP